MVLIPEKVTITLLVVVILALFAGVVMYAGVLGAAIVIGVLGMFFLWRTIYAQGVSMHVHEWSIRTVPLGVIVAIGIGTAANVLLGLSLAASAIIGFTVGYVLRRAGKW